MTHLVLRKGAQLVHWVTEGLQLKSATSCNKQTKTAAPLLEPPSVMMRCEIRLRSVLPPPSRQSHESCTKQQQGGGFGNSAGGFGISAGGIHGTTDGELAIIRLT
jgi:hypothetical protein